MRLLALLIPLALSGCASPDYALYAQTQQAIATANGKAQEARYRALAVIADTGDATSKVAAVMAIALGQPGADQHVAAPVHAGQTALQWASILVPAVTQAYGIGKNADVAINASNNAASTAIGTANAFVGMGGLIQAPAVPQANVTNTLSGTGVLGDGTMTTPAPVITPVVQIVPTVIAPVTPIVPTVITPVFEPTAP